MCNTCLSECAAKEKEDREKHKAAGTVYDEKGSAFVSTFGILRKSTAGRPYAWRRAVLIHTIFCRNIVSELSNGASALSRRSSSSAIREASDR